MRYAIRLPANNVLERRIEDLLTRPRGRPRYAPLVRYRSFEYQAASWARPRRVIAKVEHHLSELFPRVGFIVTTLTDTNRAVIRFYNRRGTAEQWIKEGKAATDWTRLSCHRFRANEVRLILGIIAYNLGNLLRRLVLPFTIQTWSLTSLQQRLFKTGGRLIRHARYFVLQLAESHLTRTSFGRFSGASSDPHGTPLDREGRTRRERETERSWREYLPAGWSPRANFRKMGRQPRGRCGDSPCDAFRTAEGARGASRGLLSNARERGLGSKLPIRV